VQGKAGASGAGFLVNFERKEPEEGNQSAGCVDRADDVEIKDSFGRSRMVEKGSKEHMAWQIKERQEERRQDQFQDEKPTMYSQDMRIDDERREWEARATADILAREEGGNRAGLGHSHGDTAGGGSSASSSTGIRSQWDKTLKGKARDDLQQINDETDIARTAHGDKSNKRQAKERRRQMLREKQQQRLNKQKAMRGEAITTGDVAGGGAADGRSTSTSNAASADATAFLQQVL
jgi:hypothetical protein